MGCYRLAVIAASRHSAGRIEDAVDTPLIDGLNAEAADWIKGWAPKISKQDAKTIAAIAVNALLGKRAAVTVFPAPAAAVEDERYIAEWTALFAGRIETLCPTES